MRTRKRRHPRRLRARGRRGRRRSRESIRRAGDVPPSVRLQMEPRRDISRPTMRPRSDRETKAFCGRQQHAGWAKRSVPTLCLLRNPLLIGFRGKSRPRLRCGGLSHKERGDFSALLMLFLLLFLTYRAPCEGAGWGCARRGQRARDGPLRGAATGCRLAATPSTHPRPGTGPAGAGARTGCAFFGYFFCTSKNSNAQRRACPSPQK